MDFLVHRGLANSERMFRDDTRQYYVSKWCAISTKHAVSLNSIRTHTHALTPLEYAGRVCWTPKYGTILEVVAWRNSTDLQTTARGVKFPLYTRYRNHRYYVNEERPRALAEHYLSATKALSVQSKKFLCSLHWLCVALARILPKCRWV
jgi:hypothetical protein